MRLRSKRPGRPSIEILKTYCYARAFARARRSASAGFLLSERFRPAAEMNTLKYSQKQYTVHARGERVLFFVFFFLAVRDDDNHDGEKLKKKPTENYCT